jgi:hypothetical protein
MCRWEKAGSRCVWPAEVQRQIPGRERLKTYPVCRWHSAMIDLGNAGDDPIEHLPDDFVVTSALMVAEAEAITRRHGGRRGADPNDDAGPR